MNTLQIKAQLDKLVERYNTIDFIENDPIAIPHLFKHKNDIEIAAFLSATIAWGNRSGIIKNAKKLMGLMDMQPFDFVKNHSEQDLKKLEPFIHRTFNGIDTIFFVKALKEIYSKHIGLENIFNQGYQQFNDLKYSIIKVRSLFLNTSHQYRSEKHIANVEKNSSAKRINMFLRWMIREDKAGVDFGLWKNIPASALYCPIDVHSGNSARKFGLLNRKQNDWKSVEELTANLKRLNPNDPVIYDYALFGYGIEEKTRLQAKKTKK